MLSVTAVLLAFPARPARADLIEKTAKVAGVTVYYKVVVPDGYDQTKVYPGIIALGGGPQTMNTVDGVLSRNFRAEAESAAISSSRRPRRTASCSSTEASGFFLTF